MAKYSFSGGITMSGDKRTGADEARAPRATWGYFSRNHEASTTCIYVEKTTLSKQSMDTYYCNNRDELIKKLGSAPS